MAHNLNFNETSKEYAFYSRKEIPWHGLGQFITEAETATQALRMAHLDYEVKSGDVYANFIPKGATCVKDASGKGFLFLDVNGSVIGSSEKKGAKIPGYKCVYRDDTKQVFDIVSDRYEIVQNFEALDIIYNVIKGPQVTDKDQIVIQTAGALNNGETIFVTAKLPSYIISSGSIKDVVDKYFVFTSSHDKSSQLTVIITDIRVVCNNTLNMALSCPNKVSLKHTKNIRENFHMFSELLGISNKYSTNAKLVLEMLAGTKVTSEQVKNFVFDMFVPDAKREFIDEKGGKIELVDSEIISTRMKNRVIEANNFIDQGAGQEVGRGTAYWMYNGMTSYIHNGMNYKTNEDRFKSLVIGGSNETLIKKAYDKALLYV